MNSSRASPRSPIRPPRTGPCSDRRPATTPDDGTPRSATSHPTPTKRSSPLRSRKRHNLNDTVTKKRGQGPGSATADITAGRASRRSTFLWSVYGRVYDSICDSPLTSLIAFTAFDLSTGIDVADLGCGTGLVFRVFAHQGCTVVGVDSSAVMLRRAQGKSRVSTAVLAAVADTPLASQSTDTVLLINVLHLLSDPAAAIVEAARIVKPSGRIVLSWPLDDVTTDSIPKADRIAGRRLVQSAVAHHLRQVIGVVAWAMRIERRATGELGNLVVEAAVANRLELLSTSTIRGVQQVTVLCLA